MTGALGGGAGAQPFPPHALKGKGKASPSHVSEQKSRLQMKSSQGPPQATSKSLRALWGRERGRGGVGRSRGPGSGQSHVQSPLTSPILGSTVLGRSRREVSVGALIRVRRMVKATRQMHVQGQGHGGFAVHDAQSGVPLYNPDMDIDPWQDASCV